MPQAIGFFLLIVIVFIALLYAVAIVWYLLQWLGAMSYWLWEVIFYPAFAFLSPALLIGFLTAGIIVGLVMTCYNYSISLNRNVVSEGKGPENLIRPAILFLLNGMLICFAAALSVFSFILIVPIVEKYVGIIGLHYSKIEYPAFEIYFPFWRDW